jgi:hypothetical protein
VDIKLATRLAGEKPKGKVGEKKAKGSSKEQARA